jgi:hypothetical protein
MATTKEQMAAVATASCVGRVWSHPSEDEVRIYVGAYFATLTPDAITCDGVAQDAIIVDVAKAIPRRGHVRTQIADAVRSAGLYPRRLIERGRA